MRKQLLLFLLIPFFFGCSTNSFDNRNPYIPSFSFSVDLNMNLPAYSNLQYPSNAIYFSGNGVGSKGIWVFCIAQGNYNAFDAACPNQSLSSCAALTLKGINLICPCDSQEYSLFTGQPMSSGTTQTLVKYPLKQYRVEVNGNVLRVYN